MAWAERTSGEHWRVRYRRGDGSVASEGGFTSSKAARSRAREIDVDRRRHTFRDPALAETLVEEWLLRWWATLDVDEQTVENYRSLVANHIGPRFGHVALGKIQNSDISEWAAELHACGYQHSTVLGLI